MSVSTVLSEVTLLFLLKILADLGLVVVVGDVEHLILHFNGQGLLQIRRKTIIMLQRIIKAKFLTNNCKSMEAIFCR